MQWSIYTLTLKKLLLTYYSNYQIKLKIMKTKSNRTRHIVTLTTGQYDHLYNIMCRQEEILDYLNESDDFDPQTFDNLFDAIINAKETYLP